MRLIRLHHCPHPCTALRVVPLVAALCLAGLIPAQARPLPPAPAHLIATAGDGQVTLNWSPVTGATAYRVLYASDAGGPYTPVARISRPHFTASGLTNWLPHSYRVAALGRWGQSAPSVPVSVVPEGAPAVPQNLRTKRGNTQISLVWTSSPGAESYTIFRSPALGAGKEMPYKTGIRSAVWTDSGLANGTAYAYRVASVLSPEHSAALTYRAGQARAATTSAPSAAVVATPSSALPLAPTHLAATLANRQLLLTWTGPREPSTQKQDLQKQDAQKQNQGKTASAVAAPILTYSLYRGTSTGGEGPKPWRAALAQPSLTGENAPDGRPYYFLATAVNAAGESAYSPEAETPSAPAASRIAASPAPASTAPSLSPPPEAASGGGAAAGPGQEAPSPSAGAGGGGGAARTANPGTPGGPVGPLPSPGAPLPPGGPDLPPPPRGSDPEFYLTLNASVLTLFASGPGIAFAPGPVTSTVTIVSQSGLLGPVQCSVSGLPPGVTAMFYPQQPELSLQVDGHSVTSVTLYLFGGGAVRGQGGKMRPASVQATLVNAGRTASGALYVDAPN